MKCTVSWTVILLQVMSFLSAFEIFPLCWIYYHYRTIIPGVDLFNLPSLRFAVFFQSEVSCLSVILKNLQPLFFALWTSRYAALVYFLTQSGSSIHVYRKNYKEKRKKDEKQVSGGFPGGTVVKNLPANAGDTGSSPGMGRSHIPRSSWAREPQLLSLRVWSLCSATREAAIVRPVHRDKEWPPLATTRESPRTEMKTQHSHK